MPNSSIKNLTDSRKRFASEERVEDASIIGVHFACEEDPIIAFQDLLGRMYETGLRVRRAVQNLPSILVRRSHYDKTGLEPLEYYILTPNSQNLMLK